jgi:hypothetical protein
MHDETYDIFSGTTNKDAVWLEAVIGLDEARRCVKSRAASVPGNYFVFHAETRSILMRITCGPEKARNAA